MYNPTGFFISVEFKEADAHACGRVKRSGSLDDPVEVRVRGTQAVRSLHRLRASFNTSGSSVQPKVSTKGTGSSLLSSSRRSPLLSCCQTSRSIHCYLNLGCLPSVCSRP